MKETLLVVRKLISQWEERFFLPEGSSSTSRTYFHLKVALWTLEPLLLCFQPWLCLQTLVFALLPAVGQDYSSYSVQDVTNELFS